MRTTGQAIFMAALGGGYGLIGDLIVGRRCQSNSDLSMRFAIRPRAIDDLRRKGAPLCRCGRASLLVDLPGDEMPFLIKVIMDLSAN
jgi:hypothetical protein